VASRLIQPGRPGLRRPGSSRAWLALAPLAAAVVALAAGCAATPVGGVAHPLPGISGQPQAAVVQPVPGPGPLPHWDAQQVVLGFLHASASFATDPSAARAYLTPGLAWNPPGTVTVVNSRFTFGSQIFLHVAGQSEQKVTVTGQRIATLSAGGQYSYITSGPETNFVFTLTSSNGQWRIEGLPYGTQLLLTQSDFDEVFQPRDLYFFSNAPALPDALVPDPVVAPTEDAATGLVNGLIHDSPSWLSGATRNEFPVGTRLIGPVMISNQTAIVDLGGTAASADSAQLTQMYEQLAATLTTPDYGSSPVANSVTLEIDGTPQSVKAPANSVPPVGNGSPSSQPLYFATGGAVQGWAGGKTATTVSDLGSPSGVTAVAATTTGSEQVAAAIAQRRGCDVQVAGPGGGGYHEYVISAAGGPCASLSWDGSGGLWAVSGGNVWVIQPLNQPDQVNTAAAELPAGSRIISVQMAPDSVRAALLVQTGQLRQIFLAAVRYPTSGVTFGKAVPVGNDLAADPGPVAISWYSPDYLLAAEGTSLFEVPLSGGASKQLLGTVPAGTQALTSAGLNSYGAMVAVATANGRVFKSVAPYISWVEAPQTGSVQSVPALPG
jgi:hypothetical protein